MATNGVDFADVRRRINGLRKPDLMECLERLGMRKSGNKGELQTRLLELFEDSYHLVNSGSVPRDMWRLAAAQRIIEDVDTYMQRIITALAAHPAVTEVEGSL
eukprot:XP_001690962.1 predicted protein [Chlamydomonas reinhardtii]